MAVDYFGERVAATYDEDESEMFDPALVAATVDFLAEQAGGGLALELAVGTGRIGIPLSERIPVHGIDLSTAMLARLRAKPGAERITLTEGDFATTKVDGPFRLVYLVFNTFMNLTSQDEQVACFGNVAEQLEPGGRFVIEVGVPQLRRLAPGETVHTFQFDRDTVGFDEYDVARQGLVSHYYRLVDGRWEKGHTPFRYVWPAELDLMARLAGLSLRERWAGWRREPFTGESRSHVSVWEKPATHRE